MRTQVPCAIGYLRQVEYLGRLGAAGRVGSSSYRYLITYQGPAIPINLSPRPSILKIICLRLVALDGPTCPHRLTIKVAILGIRRQSASFKSIRCLHSCVSLAWLRLTSPSSAFSKSKSEYFDPCQEAASKSIRCLNRNGGDRAMCTDYFE